MVAGRPNAALVHWRAFAKSAPNDPDVAIALGIARDIEARGAAAR
jgi:hypothetical protein